MNIILPSLGDIDEVEVTEICVAIGAEVGAEDSVIVIESDKASMEVPAGADGTITELLVQLGDRLGEGAVIGVLAETDESAQEASPAGAQEEVAAAPDQNLVPEPLMNVESSGAPNQKTVQLVPDLGDIEQVEVLR